MGPINHRQEEDVMIKEHWFHLEHLGEIRLSVLKYKQWKCCMIGSLLDYSLTPNEPLVRHCSYRVSHVILSGLTSNGP